MANVDPTSIMYTPMLKGKDGELGALGVASLKTRAAMLPVLDVAPVPWDFKNDRPAKTLDQHLEKLPRRLQKYWGPGQRFGLDFMHISDGKRLKDGTHPLEAVVERCRAASLDVVPVVGPDRDAAFYEAARAACARSRHGAALRIPRDRFHEPSLFSELLQETGLQAQECDLILDLRDVAQDDVQRAAMDALGALQSLPGAMRWRTVTVAASGFPHDLSKVKKNSKGSFPRTALAIWKRLRELGSELPRVPLYGDYGITHPDLSEMDPRTMKMSANIRYTRANEFLVVKGNLVKPHGYRQMYDLCRRLVDTVEDFDPSLSWGDDFIAACARNEGSTGNATTWRKLGTSHHFAVVVPQIASLLAA